MPPLDLASTAVTIIVGAISVAVAFYVKDYLQGRSEYSKLREKLEGIAGKNAFVIYNLGVGTGLGPQLFKIKEIDHHGVILEGELHTVFVPATKLIQSEILLPRDNYNELRITKMKKEFEEIADAMLEPMIEKMMAPMMKRMFPLMMSVIQEQMEQDDTEISAVIGIKIQKALESEGFEIKKSLTPKRS